MFTGIIEEVGSVQRLTPRATGSVLRISASKVAEGTREGDSICVSGVCLTAREIAPNAFSASRPELSPGPSAATSSFAQWTFAKSDFLLPPPPWSMRPGAMDTDYFRTVHDS
ncbi:MAG: hypothetical protein U5J83_01485 [Bryobacterales bacterium]|nr:hypothetical protein [Bryobacterales bacterium]